MSVEEAARVLADLALDDRAGVLRKEDDRHAGERERRIRERSEAKLKADASAAAKTEAIAAAIAKAKAKAAANVEAVGTDPSQPRPETNAAPFEPGPATDASAGPEDAPQPWKAAG